MWKINSFRNDLLDLFISIFWMVHGSYVIFANRWRVLKENFVVYWKYWKCCMQVTVSFANDSFELFDIAYIIFCKQYVFSLGFVYFIAILVSRMSQELWILKNYFVRERFAQFFHSYSSGCSSMISQLFKNFLKV